MKGLSALAFVLAAGFASAGEFGTKSDPIGAGVTSTASTGLGLMPFMQMLVALGIVLLLIKFVLPKAVNKLNKRLVTGVNSTINIEESAAFAGGNLYVVTARNKTMLLSVHASGVNFLADLSEPNTQPDPPLFMDILDREEQKPTPSYTPEQFANDRAVVETLSEDQIEQALTRLSRLSS